MDGTLDEEDCSVDRSACVRLRLDVFGRYATQAGISSDDAGAATAERDPLADQEIGKRFNIMPEDMPAPSTGPVVCNPALVLPYEGQTPRAPEGFSVTPFAAGLENPRRLLVLPNGDVIVAEQKPGYLTLLRDADGDGRAE